MRTGILRGREHTIPSQISAIAEGPVAIALSRGGAPKTYAHSAPNEDVAAFAWDEGGTLLAVADGHGGCAVAEAALETLLERQAARWTARDAGDLGASWESQALDAVFEAHQASILRAANEGSVSSRSTLVLALARPGENLLAWLSMGDSHVFEVGAESTVDLAGGERGHDFLGSPSETRESLTVKCAQRVRGLQGMRALVLATDGISEHGIGVEDPAAAVAEGFERAATQARDLRPLATARSVAEIALDSHRSQSAGDNIASAVLLLESP